MAVSASLDPDQIADARRAITRALRDGDLDAGEAMAGRWPEFLLAWWTAEELAAAWRATVALGAPLVRVASW